jgi:hypothetical protein
MDRSGEATRSLGEMLLSDFDVGLLSMGTAGAKRDGGWSVSKGIGGICVIDPKDSLPRM